MTSRKQLEVPSRAMGLRHQEKSGASANAAIQDVTADLYGRLSTIESQLQGLSSGQLELQKWLISQARISPISVSNLLSYYGKEFLFACYVHLLGRFPDPEGVRAYETQVRYGATRQSILIQIFRSDEARSRGVHVTGIHFLSLRDAISRFSRGIPLSGDVWTTERKVIHVEQLLGWNSSDFVVRCYREILGRQPDLYGLDHYSKKLARGTAKSRIIGDLAYSSEGKRRRVSIRGLWWRYRLAGIFSAREPNSSRSS